MPNRKQDDGSTDDALRAARRKPRLRFQDDDESRLWVETVHAALRGGLRSLNAVEATDYIVLEHRSRRA